MEKKTCDTCDGTGRLALTDCCGANALTSEDWSTEDYGICPDCKEHCTYGVICEECSGTGVI